MRAFRVSRPFGGYGMPLFLLTVISIGLVWGLWYSTGTLVRRAADAAWLHRHGIRVEATVGAGAPVHREDLLSEWDTITVVYLDDGQQRSTSVPCQDDCPAPGVPFAVWLDPRDHTRLVTGFGEFSDRPATERDWMVLTILGCIVLAIGSAWWVTLEDVRYGRHPERAPGPAGKPEARWLVAVKAGILRRAAVLFVCCLLPLGGAFVARAGFDNRFLGSRVVALTCSGAGMVMVVMAARWAAASTAALRRADGRRSRRRRS